MLDSVKPIDVKLIAHTNVHPLNLTSHAARVCYQAEPPKWGKRIDVESRLFNPGHHTTLQHYYLTFFIEGIAVGDITFGMHLASPFYNSDQRSGRFCAKMFLEPDYPSIERYIRTFWPEVDEKAMKEVRSYIKEGVSIYHANKKKADEISRNLLKEERPFISEKALEANAPKIAQEQLRMFIPVIFPTAFDFTVNLTALVAMWESAWTPVMRHVTEEMRKALLQKFPKLGYMFRGSQREDHNWSPEIINVPGIAMEPQLTLESVIDPSMFVSPNSEDMHPVDKLHFLPEMMDNSFGEIRTEIAISTATMGQDQRHRTIGRSAPCFTGQFYVPPIVEELQLWKRGEELLSRWREISEIVPETLTTILAPYGAMVKYHKRSSFNALIHEQGKRECFCAQEEIYHLGRFIRISIEEKYGKDSPLLRIFEPPCFRNGKCAEGVRYCGRDIKVRKTGDYFPKRRV